MSVTRGRMGEMDAAELLSERMRSHRLSAPTASVADAGAHLLATQAQEFWGGRWALAVRTRGEPALSEVDAVLDGGTLVRSWTQRGTIHLIPARDLGWVLSLTAERQFRAAASRHRTLGLDDEAFRRAERSLRARLRGGNRLTRAEVFEVLRDAGIDPGGQRGVHVIYVLAVRGVIVQGPVVPRERPPTREQYFVLGEEWITDAAAPADPLAEFFVRYLDGHGPAGVADFAWWSGLPLGAARRAAEASADRIDEVDDGLYVTRPRPRRSAKAPEVLALPSFDEYFLSYADRTAAALPEHVAKIATGGLMRPVVVARGRIVAVWSHSRAAGRRGPAGVDVLAAGEATDAEIRAALDRYEAFIDG